MKWCVKSIRAGETPLHFLLSPITQTLLISGSSFMVVHPCSSTPWGSAHISSCVWSIRGAEEFFVLISGEFLIQHLKMFYLLSDGDVKMWSLSYGFA